MSVIQVDMKETSMQQIIVCQAKQTKRLEVQYSPSMCDGKMAGRVDSPFNFLIIRGVARGGQRGHVPSSSGC